MNISLNQNSNIFLQKKSFLSKILKSNIVSIDKIGHGRNSRVHLITCENSKKYVAKLYFFHKSDKRDRMSVEFSSLRFLWSKGIRCIPEPIALEEGHRFAVYSFIEGSRIKPQDITSGDIDYASDFLTKLADLKLESESKKLSNASEACFSIKEIVASITKRYKRLTNLKKDVENNLLHNFLEKEFLPQFRDIVEWCKLELRKNNIDYSSEIDKKIRTLSPSDFGFHNALRLKNGTIVFLDFEYFGWDDPAKMLSDFLLHPGMNLKAEYKRQFVKNMLSHFHDDKDLKTRLKIVFPLFGLKWCLILLNEFIHEDFLRREFAYDAKLTIHKVQTQQLLKAKQFLAQTMKNFKNFPYADE